MKEKGQNRRAKQVPGSYLVYVQGLHIKTIIETTDAEYVRLCLDSFRRALENEGIALDRPMVMYSQGRNISMISIQLAPLTAEQEAAAIESIKSLYYVTGVSPVYTRDIQQER